MDKLIDDDNDIDNGNSEMMIMHYHDGHPLTCDDDEHGDDGDQPGPFRLPLRDRDNDFLNLPTGSNERLTD